MEFQILVDALAAFGWQGLVFAALILIGVFLARKVGLVVTGNQARIANLLLSAALYGLGSNPEAEAGLMAVLSSLLAALAFTGLEWLNAQRQ